MRLDDLQREALAGAPAFALGATPMPGGTRFAVRAPLADAVTLCLFDGDAERRVRCRREGELHVAEVPGVGPGHRYGYRSSLDPAKLLVDPYAVEIDRPYAYDFALGEPGVETSALVPKAIVPAPLPPVTSAPAVWTPGGLIYELNVRGFTMRHPDVPPDQRGTLAALAHPAVIAHLRKLHVAAVELMPIVAWIDERHLPPLGLRNAWGYNPVTPMALDPRLAPGGVAELRATIAALHAAGIGVFLDLVFNHTGESDVAGPTLSLRGLDPAAYAHDADGALVNYAGTGNMLDAGQPAVRRLIVDSLRHFVAQGVDGFRFDLAPVIARGPEFDAHAPIFAEIAADPLLAVRIMIAEPWDVGPDGYRLGQFPVTWLEWNDRYRDDVRRFWRGDGSAGVLAERIAGSADLFGSRATRTVNYLAAHDGFTLADLVSHDHRHNEANGEEGRDGHVHEVSWNSGIEGATDEPAVLARRAADVRALLATLFASRGAIMLTAGDEFGRSQGGNNNAYAQDELGWLDWEGRDRELEAFVVERAAWRAAHPTLADPWYFHCDEWLDADGAPMTPEQWAAADAFELRFLDLSIRVDRRAGRVEITSSAGDSPTA